MVFSAALLRRVISSARPFSSRAFVSCRRGHESPFLWALARQTNRLAHSSSTCAECCGCRICGSFSSRTFSTQVQKVANGADSRILQVLDAEIKCAEECDDQDRRDEVPDRFPFEVKDIPGTNTVALSRDYHGEAVKIIVSMPNLVTGDDGDDIPRDRQGSSQSCLPLLVNVSKGDHISLEFSCTAYPDEVCIDSMVVKETHLEDEELAYEGPDFHDLDENLQKAFHKYLEIRGVSPATTNYLHEYMINKDSREYLLWLRSVKIFIEE